MNIKLRWKNTYVKFAKNNMKYMHNCGGFVLSDINIR